MGNQQSRGTTFGTFQIENLIGELPHVVYKGPLGEIYLREYTCVVVDV